MRPSRNPQKNIINTINNYIQDANLKDAEVSLNTKAGTASIRGIRDGYEFTTVISIPSSQRESLKQKQPNKTKYNIAKQALYSQIRQLYQQGLNQTAIARELNISQPLVSKYLRGVINS